ncbi:MAG: alcohol dehydrogenase catalytic domain-containing protein [Myxococcota bacterium]
MNHRVAVFEGAGQVELRSEALPAPKPGEALVRLRACALCTMEQRLWTGRMNAYPIVAGHEAAGVVVDVHPGAVGPPKGARVALAMLDRCMECYACRRGDTHLCTGKFRGREPGKMRRIGGLADHVCVPTWKLFAMPDELSFDEIAFAEPLACVVHSVNKGAVRLGDDVLVIGGGTMGQLHVMVARLRGARVLVSEPDPDKRRVALEHGAAFAFEPEQATARARELTEGRGADVVFVTHGNDATSRQAAVSVRAGGTILYYGSFPAEVGTNLGPRRIHNEETVLDGARSHTLDDWSSATKLLAYRLVDVRPLISSRFELEQITVALEQASAGEGFRVVVQMDGGA